MAQGFNFRATAGYVTDGAETTYVLAADTYPTTRAGATFGWVDPIGTRQARDRSTAGDVRLAGIVFLTSSGAALQFVYDLPGPGVYDITLAIGDPTSASTPVVKIKDNTTVLSALPASVPAANNFADATGVVRTAAAWPAGNVAYRGTFATSKLIIEMGPQVSQSTPIAHLTVTPVASAPTITTQPSNQTVTAGATATFSASASGSPAPTWQWQRSTDSGSTWADISGAAAAIYTTPATTVSGGSANSGDQYRAVATNSGGSATSNAGTLTVNVAGDTTPPTQGGAIAIGAVTSASIQMSWPAGADNVAVAGYDVSSNGGSTWVQIGNVLTHTFSGLTASTTYALRVRPRDAASNVGATPLAASQATSAPAPTASVTVTGIANGSGTLLTVTLPNVVILQRSNRAALLALTNQAVTSGAITITNAALGAAGTGVMVAAFDGDGDPAGIWPATVV